GDQQLLDIRPDNRPARRHQHGKVGKALEHGLVSDEQGMPGPYDKHDLFRVEMLEGKSRHLFRRRQPSDHEIELTDAELLEQYGILTGDNLDAAAGLFLEKQ